MTPLHHCTAQCLDSLHITHSNTTMCRAARQAACAAVHASRECACIPAQPARSADPIFSTTCSNGAQKLLGVLITIGEAVAYVVSGMYGDVRELGAGNAILIIVQVCWSWSCLQRIPGQLITRTCHRLLDMDRTSAPHAACITLRAARSTASSVRICCSMHRCKCLF